MLLNRRKLCYCSESFGSMKQLISEQELSSVAIDLHFSWPLAAMVVNTTDFQFHNMNFLCLFGKKQVSIIKHAHKVVTF